MRKGSAIRYNVQIFTHTTMYFVSSESDNKLKLKFEIGVSYNDVDGIDRRLPREIRPTAWKLAGKTGPGG